MTDKKQFPPLQSIKAWMSTYYKLKFILNGEHYRNKTMGELLDEVVEEYIKVHGL
jgi:hypothetical protein